MIDYQTGATGKPPRDPSTPSRPGQVSTDEGIDPGPPAADQLSTGELLESLSEDRLWLLKQLDSGRWPEWRLDLAALERELGHLLDQAREQLEGS